MAFTRREIVATASMVALAAVASHSHAQGQTPGNSQRFSRGQGADGQGKSLPAAGDRLRRGSSTRR